MMGSASNLSPKAVLISVQYIYTYATTTILSRYLTSTDGRHAKLSVVTIRRRFYRFYIMFVIITVITLRVIYIYYCMCASNVYIHIVICIKT